MDTKLTLKLDEKVIKRAKNYAQSKKISLSAMIENYLDAITKEEKEFQNITPFVKSIASGVTIPNDLDAKKLYREHLSKKHQ